MSRRILRLAAALLVVAATACDSNDNKRSTNDGAPPRPFLMGLSALPRELNADAYADAIAFAGDHADLVLIQRTVPWQDFLPGSHVREETAEITAAERAAVEDGGLDLFFAVDVTDGASGRDRLAALPPALEGRRFDDAGVRAAFVSYAEYVALNYHPRYIALGVEMNLYYEKNKEDFENFRTLQAAAYDAVKRTSPDTLVTVTLQYEDLQGVLPRDDKHFPSWQLVRAFDPKLDFVAISTYPSVAFADAAAIPDNYYSQLRAFTDKPIAIAEMGYASGAQGAAGGEGAQAAFLRRALLDAERMAMPFVVWYAIWDPGYARDTPFSAFATIGLLREDETEKPAWPVWSDAAQRPYRPG